MSNYLPTAKVAQGIAMLCEGMGLRPASRVLDCQHETLIKYARKVGEGCAKLHDKLFVNLKPERLELDEAWSFVFKKQARLEPGDSPDYGDQYSFIAMDAEKKAILAYHVGKRNGPNTMGFALDLASRVVTSPQISSDGFQPYIKAVREAFGPDADYAQLIKRYENDCAAEAARRYTPSDVSSTEKIVISGEPDEEDISTAYVERQNLTLRMLTRRFNRLTNAHSKTLRNHRAAFDLYVGYYNFCWKHETLKMTPAMAVGVTDKPWTVEKLIEETAWRGDSIPPDRPGDRAYARYLSERQKGKKK